MTRVLTLFRIAAICAVLATVAHAETVGTLTWNNRDQLDGELRAIDQGKVVWQSDLFRTAQRIDADFLSNIVLQTTKEAATNNAAFRLETNAGDTLFGDLVEISDTQVVLRSARFGQLSVRRDAVRELRQLKHNKVVYDGPRWLDDWRVLKVGRELSEWSATDMGFLTTSKYGGEIYHDLPQLQQAEINLAISWKEKSGFQIDFSPAIDLMGVRSKPKLSIKSWGADIVAQSSFGKAGIVPLLRLEKHQTELRLRIIWDNLVGRASVVSSTGRAIAEVPIEKMNNRQPFGVLFKNRSDDLTIEQIRLSKWKGVANSEERKPGRAYVRLADGKLVEDSIASYAIGNGGLTLQSGNTIPIDQLAIAEFTPTAKQNFESSRVRFADGTVVSGTVTSLRDRRISLQSRSLQTAITGNANGLSHIRFFNERTHEFDFELLAEGRRLSGNLKPVDGSKALGWASVGCDQAVAIRDGVPYTIERRLSEDVQAPTSGREIVYLRDGSVVLGEVNAMRAKALAVQTRYTGEVSIPFDDLRAMEMIRSSGRASFTDSNWQFLQETKPDQRSPEHLAVSKTISLQNQELHHAGKLTFSVQWESGFVGLLTIQLGESSKHVIRCSFSKNRVSARCLVNAASAVKLPTIPEQRANISVETSGQRISIWVNGILASSADTGKNIPDTGIWIQCGSARSGRVLSRTGSTEARITLSRLRVGDSASRLGAGFAAEDELTMLLRIPRNKRRPPPEHILCATNRDLLRGKLVDINADEIRFASGFQKVDLPRSKVAAVVWLGELPTDIEALPARTDGPVTEAWLQDGSIFVVDDLQLNDAQLLGQHKSLQQIQIPIEQLWKVQHGASPPDRPKTGVADWNLVPTKEPQLVSGTDQGTESPLVDQDVSELELTMLEDQPFLVSDARDQIIVLDFWASWCAPCVKSLPRLRAVVDSFPSERVKLIGINQGEAPFTVQTFLAHQDLKLDVAMDPSGELAKRFAVSSIPQTIVIGPQGKIRRVFLGTPSALYTRLSDAIKELLPPTD